MTQFCRFNPFPVNVELTQLLVRVDRSKLAELPERQNHRDFSDVVRILRSVYGGREKGRTLETEIEGGAESRGD